MGFLCLGCILIAVGILLTIKRKWYGQAELDKLALKDNEETPYEPEVPANVVERNF